MDGCIKNKKIDTLKPLNFKKGNKKIRGRQRKQQSQKNQTQEKN